MDTPHPDYEVTHIAVANEPDGQGNFAKHFTTHFRTAEGTESYVKHHVNHFTARNVHDAIAHEAHRIKQVHNLGHGEPPPHETA